MATKQLWSSIADIVEEKKLLHQAQVSQSVLDDARAYKEYARSVGNHTTMNEITEDALRHFITTHKEDMVAYHDQQKHRLQRL